MYAVCLFFIVPCSVIALSINDLHYVHEYDGYCFEVHSLSLVYETIANQLSYLTCAHTRRTYFIHSFSISVSWLYLFVSYMIVWDVAEHWIFTFMIKLERIRFGLSPVSFLTISNVVKHFKMLQLLLLILPERTLSKHSEVHKWSLLDYSHLFTLRYKIQIDYFKHNAKYSDYIVAKVNIY